MNTITIKGRLTRDPELRTVQSDLKIATFSVAVDRKFSKEKKADFFDCKAFRRQAEVISTHFTKGKEILISGRMEQSKWTDKNGATRISWELVVEDFEFCGAKNTQNEVAPASAYAPSAGDGNPFTDEPPFDMNDEELDALPL